MKGYIKERSENYYIYNTYDSYILKVSSGSKGAYVIARHLHFT